MKRIVMLGTAFDTRGGISSVLKVYRDQGLFDRQPITYLATHCDGTRLRKLGQMLRSWVRFMVLLFMGRIALVHIHLASRASFWRKLSFAAPAVWCGLPVILHLHGGDFTDFYESGCGAMGRWLVRWVFRRAAHVVVLSEGCAQWIRDALHRQDVQVVHNPVSLPESSGSWATRQPGLGLCLGRMSRLKGTFDLLNALAILKSQDVAVHLALAGDGDETEVLQTVLRLGLQDRVQLLGWVGGAQRDELLRRATFLALPSHREAMPMSVLEAMAAGLPIIATPVGGVPEAVTDGVEGFLVEPGDLPALADRIARLVRDPELAAKMGRQGREKVARAFAAAALVPQIERLYLDILLPAA